MLIAALMTTVQTLTGHLANKGPKPPLPQEIWVAALNPAGIKDKQFKRKQLRWLTDDYNPARGLQECGVLGLSETATKGNKLTTEEKQKFTDEICPTGRAVWTQHCGIATTDLLDGYAHMEAYTIDSERAILVMLGRTTKIEVAFCVVYPHGGNAAMRKYNLNEIATLLQRVPEGVPLTTFGDWNLVQDPAKDTVHGCANNDGLKQWKRLAADANLTELLDAYGGDTRTRTELTFSPFGARARKIKPPAPDNRVFADCIVPPPIPPRLAKRLDWYACNVEACALIDTYNIRSVLLTVPPWFKPEAGDEQAGTDHSTIFLKQRLPKVQKQNRDKQQTQANAAILQATVPGQPTYAERATPILTAALQAVQEAAAEGNHERVQELQDQALLDCVRVAYGAHEAAVQAASNRDNAVTSCKKEIDDLDHELATSGRDLQDICEIDEQRGRAMSRFRNAIEAIARGKINDLHEANHSDAAALSRLVKGRRSRTVFEKMKVCKLENDIQGPELMSTETQRAKYAFSAPNHTNTWSCPCPPRLHVVTADAGSEHVTALEDMKKNVSNNYAWLLRERAVNLAAQDELLDTIDMEEALPKEILAVLARAANVPEMTSLIELLKDGKAPGPEGAIAEMLKANKIEWAAILTISFNASYKAGRLSVAMRFGLMSLVYKKKDATDLNYYRGLTMTCPLYKLFGLMLQERWKRVLPAVTYECQHGFIFMRSLVENIYKVLDAGDYIDMEADAADAAKHDDDADEETATAIDPTSRTYGTYICDRTKAFDRVSFLWLVRCAARICGVKLPILPELQAYWNGRRDKLTARGLCAESIATEEIEAEISEEIGECPDTLQLYYDYPDTPDAVRWIIVLLHDHVRRANLNGTKSDAWKLLCSVFQGCTFAPSGWGVGADPEARMQVKDPAVKGIITPRTGPRWAKLMQMLSSRYADDTVNTPHIDSMDALLDNNCRWCMASGGGTEPSKQALMLRGEGRNSGVIWGKSFDVEPAPDTARTKFVHAHSVVESLGILDGGRADPGTATLPTWEPNSNTPQRPSQQQIGKHRAAEQWQPITERMISTIRNYSRHFLSFAARLLVLDTFYWSIAWYLFDVRPLKEDCARMKYLESAHYAFLWTGRLPDCFMGVEDTDLRKVARTYTPLLKRLKASAGKLDGGLGAAPPALTGRARLTGTFTTMLKPKESNLHTLTGALWYVFARSWLLEAIGAKDTNVIGAIIDHRQWTRTLKRMATAGVPDRWQQIARAWSKLLPHIVVTPPDTYEQIMSMALYGGALNMQRNNPLDANDAYQMSDIWDGGRRSWREGLTTRDQTRLTKVVPEWWTDLLRAGPTAIGADEWILNGSALRPSTHPHHPACGAPHYELGVLYHVGAHVCGAAYELNEYMLGCNEAWELKRSFCAAIPATAARATVEPATWTTGGPAASRVILVGRTEESWSDSRGRLVWADAAMHGAAQQYVVMTDMAGRRSRWTHARTPRQETRPTANAARLWAQLENHPTVTLAHTMRTLGHTQWSVAVKNFAWSCTAGCLPNGYACSGGLNNLCPMCGTEEQSVYHELAECTALRHARRWLREAASELVPEVDKESVPSFVITGQHKALARKRTTLALRGCFFAQWRAQRSAAIHGQRPRSRGKIRDALNKRLRAAILRDWIRSHGQRGFERRWRSYVEITDGIVSIVNLPLPRKVDKPGTMHARAFRQVAGSLGD